MIQRKEYVWQGARSRDTTQVVQGAVLTTIPEPFVEEDS
jgi:hypothetical protein